MPELRDSFVHLRGVLTEAELVFLKNSCKAQLETENIPCFALLNRLHASCYLKIRELVKDVTGEDVKYLNDFYMYTDSSCVAGWHMDTELYTFENAVNAWILLSPEEVAAPFGVLRGINETASERYYHTMEITADECEFGNLCTGESESMPLAEIETRIVTAPEVSVGDVLLFNPRRFHKTMTGLPKHCHVIKFVFGNKAGCLSNQQVPAFFWPEVAIFNNLVSGEDQWDGVLDGLRRALRDEEGKRSLSAGFYPSRFPIYRKQSRFL